MSIETEEKEKPNSQSSSKNIPILNQLLNDKTTDKINSVLMFNLSKNSMIYQNEICLNFIVLNCHKEAIIININGEKSLISWTNHFLKRFHIYIYCYHLYINIDRSN